MNADQINTHLLQADIEAASRPPAGRLTPAISEKEQCWGLIEKIIDRDGPGGREQIEYDELAQQYGGQPNDAIWTELLRGLEASIENDEHCPAGHRPAG